MPSMGRQKLTLGYKNLKYIYNLHYSLSKKKTKVFITVFFKHFSVINYTPSSPGALLDF